ncbi:hypothetical protein pv_381 [Pithovirus sibericum]|uniref:Uncharacterized protein n=1 Tax=Pithovirus sibericum TaxID=1450746 RepID=W5S6I3_9VIRU|nr:hypothetical protein pv_381 [Pithovirus sibericum]AHH01947.1 hypothetical protein pv_381 [Pithovirus sibericum]
MKNPSYFFVTSYKIRLFEQKLFLLDLGEIITSNMKFSSEIRWENCNLVTEFQVNSDGKIAIW